jgi:hypothetical protein
MRRHAHRIAGALTSWTGEAVVAVVGQIVAARIGHQLPGR